MSQTRLFSLTHFLLARNVAAALLLPASGMVAQSKPPSGATITGHVTFADSDKPARFATVYLKSITPPDSREDFFTVLMDSAMVNMQAKQSTGGQQTDADARELSTARAASSSFLAGVTDAMLSATVSSDGEYVFTGVPPGAYYVHAKAPGYVDTLAAFSSADLASGDPEVRKKIAAAVDTVAVVGNERVRENLGLERGGVLAGRIVYDDGSPATGWTVRAVLKRLAGEDPPSNVFGIDLSQLPSGQKLDRALTDDLGRFRIAGLPAGTYILQANLTTAALDRQPFSPVSSSAGSFLSMLGGLSGMSGLRVTVYSGSAMHLHDAEAIVVHPGEERSGNDLVVPLSTSLSVAGVVLTKADGHLINSGTVELIAQDKDGRDDPSLHLSATIAADGTFRFDYVPAPSTYTLRCLHPGDSTTMPSSMKLLGSAIAEHKIQHLYGLAQTTVALRDADLAGLRLVVEDPPARTAQVQVTAH